MSSDYTADYALQSIDTVKDELLERICAMAIEGRSMREISVESGKTLVELQRYIMSSEDRRRLFTMARRDGHEILADDLMAVHRGEGSDTQKKLFSTNVMWLLSRRLKDKYSERVEVDGNQRVSITDALLEARGRLPARSVREVESEDMEVIGEVDELGRVSEEKVLPAPKPHVFVDEEDVDRGGG